VTEGTEKSNEYASQGWSVPSMRAEVLGPKTNRYALIIPVLNEGSRIQRQLRETAQGAYATNCDVIIADGGSTDGSLEPDFLRTVGVRALLTKTGPGKLSAQLRCGYAFALTEGYQGIVTIDGNGKDSVESIPAFVEALDSGIDYAQASRFIPGGEGVNTPLLRLLAIRLMHAPALSLAARHWLTDTTQGYRSYSSRYLLDARVQPFRNIFVGYELLAYLTVRAGQLGYSVKEIPTTRSYPDNEPIPTKIGGLRAYADLISILWKVLRGQYAPEASRR